MHIRHALATSEHPLARGVRRAARSAWQFSLPVPRLIGVPIVKIAHGVRATYYFLMRVFICEPWLKAHCARYGKNVHTGAFLHWVSGSGEIVLGDTVVLDGKATIIFGARYSKRPTLTIGNNSGIGHMALITVAKAVTIGNYCRIASGVVIFDSPGHPAEPVARREGRPVQEEDIKPVTIQDNVWIGRNAAVFPGVTIGEGSIVAVGAVVTTDVPPYSLVAGNPARKIGTLTRPADVKNAVAQ